MFNGNNPWAQLQMMGQRPTAFPGQAPVPTNGAWAGGTFAPPGLQNRPMGQPMMGQPMGMPNRPMGQPMMGMPYGRRPLAP